MWRCKMPITIRGSVFYGIDENVPLEESAGVVAALMREGVVSVPYARTLAAAPSLPVPEVDFLERPAAPTFTAIDPNPRWASKSAEEILGDFEQLMERQPLIDAFQRAMAEQAKRPAERAGLAALAMAKDQAGVGVMRDPRAECVHGTAGAWRDPSICSACAHEQERASEALSAKMHGAAQYELAAKACDEARAERWLEAKRLAHEAARQAQGRKNGFRTVGDLAGEADAEPLVEKSCAHAVTDVQLRQWPPLGASADWTGAMASPSAPTMRRFKFCCDCGKTLKKDE